jgi:hypothetical protein
LAVTLTEKEDRQIVIRFRLFDDDGLVSRWIPTQKNLTYFKSRKKRTQFAMTEIILLLIQEIMTPKNNDYTTSKLSEIRGLTEKTKTDNVSQTTFQQEFKLLWWWKLMMVCISTYMKQH